MHKFSDNPCTCTRIQLKILLASHPSCTHLKYISSVKNGTPLTCTEARVSTMLRQYVKIKEEGDQLTTTPLPLLLLREESSHATVVDDIVPLVYNQNCYLSHGPPLPTMLSSRTSPSPTSSRKIVEPPAPSLPNLSQIHFCSGLPLFREERERKEESSHATIR